MGRIVRKNLMVDADELREWAARHGTNESVAVRDAVRMALAGQEMVAALQGLHEVGAFFDFEALFPPITEPDAPDHGRARRGSPKAGMTDVVGRAVAPRIQTKLRRLGQSSEQVQTPGGTSSGR